ncbi:Oidioi.mRNA.OKI2018_I69.PAR.g12028.t2.cds [Oikopleura dioica]|uniref:Oidioi.mRNA.OKI2018_I69.PAR.g12028.t2.cds n=1 Tax=Oikopleura dioica TaxID=34765 RepID=A0ABN7S401_OIKDI|nr:Oidioi.mRNA.OKI2018_I69.PAR.g12028.t2.cds [Oikopleura dioica]
MQAPDQDSLRDILKDEQKFWHSKITEQIDLLDRKRRENKVASADDIQVLRFLMKKIEDSENADYCKLSSKNDCVVITGTTGSAVNSNHSTTSKPPTSEPKSTMEATSTVSSPLRKAPPPPPPRREKEPSQKRKRDDSQEFDLAKKLFPNSNKKSMPSKKSNDTHQKRKDTTQQFHEIQDKAKNQVIDHPKILQIEPKGPISRNFLIAEKLIDGNWQSRQYNGASVRTYDDLISVTCPNFSRALGSKCSAKHVLAILKPKEMIRSYESTDGRQRRRLEFTSESINDPSNYKIIPGDRQNHTCTIPHEKLSDEEDHNNKASNSQSHGERSIIID